jgi:hypothetical protein
MFILNRFDFRFSFQQRKGKLFYKAEVETVDATSEKIPFGFDPYPTYE